VDKLIHSREKQYYLLITFYISSFFMTRQIQSTEQSVFLNSKTTPCFKFKLATLFWI